MTANIGSIINLKYELEYKFKTKVYEQTSQAEERAKILTSLVFTEISAFFEKMHQFNFESELAMMDSEKSFFKSYIGTQFALGAIKCSEIINNLQINQEYQLSTYNSKKEDIEKNIAELKSKITTRETTLSNLESQINNIEKTVDTADETKINQLDNSIKNIQNNLQKTQTEATNDINEQKEVSEDIKVVAANSSTDTIHPTITMELNENFDKNIATAEDKLSTEITTNETTSVGEKREMIKETTQNLKESAQNQKEIIQAEKEAIASLEKTTQTLLNNNDLNTTENNYIVEESRTSRLKESLKDAYEALEELSTYITKALLGKKKQTSSSEENIVEKIDSLNIESKATSIKINNLIKESIQSGQQLITTKTEVLLISKEMESVDKILENYKIIAENSNKIVLDKQLTDVYEQLSEILGKDKVILDRREGGRRSNPERRTFGATEKEINEIQTNNKRFDSDRRLSFDRRERDTKSIYSINELDYIINSKNNTNK